MKIGLQIFWDCCDVTRVQGKNEAQGCGSRTECDPTVHVPSLLHPIPARLELPRVGRVGKCVGVDTKVTRGCIFFVHKFSSESSHSTQEALQRSCRCCTSHRWEKGSGEQNKAVWAGGRKLWDQAGIRRGGGGDGLLLALGDVSNDKIRVIPHGMLCVPFPVPPRAAGIGPYSQRPHREEEKKARKGPLHWGLHCTNFSGLQLFSSVKWGFVNKYLFQELRGFKS